MKTYIKPTLEILKAEAEAVLGTTSIPKDDDTKVDPGSSLAPVIGFGVFDDEEDEED